VDEATRYSPPAYELPLPEVSFAGVMRRLRRLALAACATLLFAGFVAGGCVVGALSLVAWTHVEEPAGAVLPTGVREAMGSLGSLAGSATTTIRDPNLLLAALPDWQGSEPFSILLLGIDQRDDEAAAGTDPGRTDTMMLLRIDPQAKTAGLIGFPRDMWVDLPGFGQGRINTAYTYGELNAARVPGGGPGLAKRTLEANFGLHVDYYALVNLHGLEQIVDTLGGVVIDVEKPVKDNEYPFGDYGVQRLYIPAGLQYMDGATALQYARSRHSENDIGRMGRQQRVLFAMRQRALQLNMLARAPQLVQQAHAMVKTDLNVDQLIRLAKLAQQVTADRIQNLVIGPPLVWDANPRADDYRLLWDKARVHQTLTAFIAGMNPQRATARIAVLNGSGRAGLAADTAKYLLNLGYNVTRIDDADRSDYADAVLEVVPEQQGVAQDLATELHLAGWTTQPPNREDPEVEVRLIVGRNFQLPAPAMMPTPSAADSSVEAPPLPRVE